MKTLIVYYSRTGNTEIIANVLADKLNSDTERIIDVKKRSGIVGWILGGKDGMEKNLTDINNVVHNPSLYDLVILGTPIWVNTPPAMRTYLSQFSGKFKHVAFFCTMGSSGCEKLFQEMGHISGAKPVAIMAITNKQIQTSTYQGLVEKFTKEIAGMITSSH